MPTKDHGLVGQLACSSPGVFSSIPERWAQGQPRSRLQWDLGLPALLIAP